MLVYVLEVPMPIKTILLVIAVMKVVKVVQVLLKMNVRIVMNHSCLIFKLISVLLSVLSIKLIINIVLILVLKDYMLMMEKCFVYRNVLCNIVCRRVWINVFYVEIWMMDGKAKTNYVCRIVMMGTIKLLKKNV